MTVTAHFATAPVAATRAMISHSPAATPVTVPLLTVATDSSEDSQVTVPEAGVVVAVIDVVAFFATVAVVLCRLSHFR